ncbi:Tim44 domain-containing protein [Pseudaeromonas paramecii]|uniref:Tim44-like domain-containing protein n=1 Tax=Pseudaeromonas paramecii TaxID=2138166 RepID=A0ABP8Q7X8_9GAMM
MKKWFSLVAVLLVTLSLGLATTAEAAKFGGSKSFGKSYRTAPSQPKAQTVNSSKPTVAPQRNKSGLMGGLLGGLLAGGLFAWLLGSGAFEGLQIMDMLLMAGIAFVLFKLFRSMTQKRQQAMSPAYGAPAGSFGQPQSFEPAHSQSFESNQTAAGGTTTQDGVPFELPPGFDAQAFVNEARDHYRQLQQAWNKNDLAKIAEYVSPELLAALQAERAQHPGEQFTEVQFVDAELVRAQYDSQQAELSVRFSGRYRDGQSQQEFPIQEIWHLERRLDEPGRPWIIVGLEEA